ncbi:VOC family protein [Streptomyces sp. NBC_01723]|uniref:VOC family protein n=1 Tax=unclassified Streptomyces TaxID=2593676 RepID=UPI0027899487|nr:MULTISPECIES: VOC family protein [unclassified Streptomyces]MDQ0408600.1 catechol 2,3-dioxygenase-like lactoylglutathione lyase family enzyme [Streptomyces sp. DSM 40167]
MDLRLHTSSLPHDDPDAALAFYRDVLGFEVRQDVGRGRTRWITVSPAGRPDTALLLAPAAAGAQVTDAERGRVLEMMAKGTWGLIVLATGDLDATFARVQAAGAEIVQEPARRAGGVRECAVRDPAGNLVRIREVPRATGGTGRGGA